MNATDKADFELGAVAHVNFRVRCETLSHGEEVFLVPSGGLGQRKVSLSLICYNFERPANWFEGFE
jgi:hypothetical protein